MSTSTCPREQGSLGGPVLPRYDGHSLLNLPASICRALDVPAGDLAPALDPALLPPAMLDGVTAVLLLVVDGLGRWQVDRAMAAGDAPTLARIAERAQARGPTAPGEATFGTVTSLFPWSTIRVLTKL